MDVRDFDFDLPPELIAQEPPAVRGGARLLHVDRASRSFTHTRVTQLPEILRAGDLVVVNNTRVFPARLLGRRDPSGGAVECLLVRRLAPDSDPGSDLGQTRVRGRSDLDLTVVESELWEALVHPGQKLKPGARMVFDGRPAIYGEILNRLHVGRRTVRLWTDDGSPLDAAVDAIGHMPLPPYIKRDDRPDDRDRYQTVFARTRGSIAAPTAGLHFTPTLTAALTARGVEIADITLHVGYGTFQPIRVARVEDHVLEAERYEITAPTAAAINSARAAGRRIIAVGTTTTRTLEAVARAHDGAIVAGTGDTDLFLYPGAEFRIVGGLLTNFHLPQSSLLMLVSAFAGRDLISAAYRAAVEERYRFYSYGDAMLIL